MRRLFLPLVLVLLLGGAVIPLLVKRRPGAPAGTPTPNAPTVQTAVAESRAVARTLYLSGVLKSGSEAALAAKQGGRVVMVAVRRGDPVRRGQVLVQVDPEDARQQHEAARAALRAAEAQVEKAQVGLRLKEGEVERRIREARRGAEQARLALDRVRAGIALEERAAAGKIRQAEAALDAARADLARARQGARPEQRRQAELNVQAAERAVATARRTLDDTQFLFDRGGATRQQLDQAKDAHQRALDGVAQARAALAVVEAGPTPAEVAAAEAQVRSAEAAVATARAAAERDALDRAAVAAAEAEVRAAEDAVRDAEASRGELATLRSDVSAARAARDQAGHAERLAALQVTAAAVVSPVDGLAAEVHVAVGETAGPGRPVVTVVGTAGVYLEAAAASRVVGQLRQGQEAAVLVDALPGRRFPGAIRRVGASAGADGRSFPVQIDVAAPAGVLKPGGLARAEVRVEALSDAVSVPAAALRPTGGQSALWVIRGGTAYRVVVEVPLLEGDRALVRGDLRAGERVAVAGLEGLREGERVQAAPAGP